MSTYGCGTCENIFLISLGEIIFDLTPNSTDIFSRYFCKVDEVEVFINCLYDLFNRLQDEHNTLEEEIRRTIEESKIVQEKYKSMYEDSRREVVEKQQYLEELRMKVRST